MFALFHESIQIVDHRLDICPATPGATPSPRQTPPSHLGCRCRFHGYSRTGARHEIGHFIDSGFANRRACELAGPDVSSLPKNPTALRGPGCW